LVAITFSLHSSWRSSSQFTVHSSQPELLTGFLLAADCKLQTRFLPGCWLQTANCKLPTVSRYSGVMPSKETARVKVVSSRKVFRGPVFSIDSDRVIEPGGIAVRRDTVRHQGSVVVLAVDESRTMPLVLLERQYRYPTAGYLWELPAGRIDEGETALAGAKRELLEETGFTAKRWKRILFFYSSPGFLDETMTIFLARDLVAGQAHPEEDESIVTKFFTLDKLVVMATSGRLRDAKTIAGVLWFAQSRVAGKARH
jgi:ADP-ribose pyrophosphatase